MNTAVLSDGISYYIPNADLTFFKELAARMKWELVGKTKDVKKTSSAISSSWVDDFAGKWKDNRSTSQIIKDIHAARFKNRRNPNRKLG